MHTVRNDTTTNLCRVIRRKGAYICWQMGKPNFMGMYPIMWISSRSDSARNLGNLSKQISEIKSPLPTVLALGTRISSRFRKKKTLVAETATAEMNATGCDGRPESLQQTQMNDSCENRTEVTGRKMEVLAPKQSPKLDSGMEQQRTTQGR